MQRDLEASIAREAAQKGHLLQIRGKVQSRAKWHQWYRAKEASSASSMSTVDAERSIRDAITRAQLFLEAATRPKPDPASKPASRGVVDVALPSDSATVLSDTADDPSDERPRATSSVKLNRTRRSPFAPVKPPLPRLLTREQLASTSTSPSLDADNQLASGSPALGSASATATTSSSDKRRSMPVPDTTFLQDREAVNQRLAAFYAPRRLAATDGAGPIPNGDRSPNLRPPPSSWGNRKFGSTPPMHIASSLSPSPSSTASPLFHPSSPPKPLRPVSEAFLPSGALNGTDALDEPALPVWVDEILDHIAHPLHHHRLSTGPKADALDKHASISSLDDLKLELHLPAPSPTRGEWDMIDAPSTTDLPLNQPPPSSPAEKIRKRASLILKERSRSRERVDGATGVSNAPTNGSTKGGWLKSMTNKVAHSHSLSRSSDKKQLVNGRGDKKKQSSGLSAPPQIALDESISAPLV